MKKINKNEMYVLLQPKHSLMSLVVVNNEEFPLCKENHDYLDRLSSMSDLVLVFTDKCCELTKHIDKNKFASLYNACAWIYSADDSINDAVFKALLYSKEVFNCHVSYGITDTEKLKDIKDSDAFFNNLTNISFSSLAKPILDIKRCSSSELFDNYYVKPKENSWLDKFKNNKVSEAEDYSGMFYTHTSESIMLFFRADTIELFFDFIKNRSDEPSKLFNINSFDKYTNVRFMFASFVKYLCISNLNINLEDLTLGETE